MAGNKGQIQWMEKLKETFPDRFTGVNVLEVGSADINGGMRHLFTDSDYHGLDVAEGRGVNIVAIAHEYDSPDNAYDVVCSANALEHDMYWKKTLKKMVDLVKSGGLMWFIVCYKWEEHGTKNTSPEQSLSTGISEEWSHYYKNLSIDDILSILDMDDFSDYVLEINPFTDIDVCFWGIKK